MPGTVLHNPMSNLNNAVGYADPRRFAQPVALGTDGIGANMIETFRLAYVLHRAVDVTATPDTASPGMDGTIFCRMTFDTSTTKPSY